MIPDAAPPAAASIRGVGSPPLRSSTRCASPFPTSPLPASSRSASPASRAPPSPSSDGQIQSCYAAGGSVRIVDAAAGDACNDRTRSRSGWTSAAGPAMARPAAGPRRRQGRDRRAGRRAGPGRPVVRARPLPRRQSTPSHHVHDAGHGRHARQGLHVVSGKASTYEREALGTTWLAMVSCRLLQKSAAAPRPCTTSRTPRSPTTATSAPRCADGPRLRAEARRTSCTCSARTTAASAATST